MHDSQELTVIGEMVDPEIDEPGQLIGRAAGPLQHGEKAGRALAYFRFQDRDEETFLGTEVVIDEPQIAASRRRNFAGGRRVEALLAEQRATSGQQAFPSVLPSHPAHDLKLINRLIKVK